MSHLDVTAILGSDLLHIFVSNRSVARSAPLEVDVCGVVVGAPVDVECLTGLGPRARHTWEAPYLVWARSRASPPRRDPSTPWCSPSRSPSSPSPLSRAPQTLARKCGYNTDMEVATCRVEVGVRELKNNLSRYLDRVREGAEVIVTDRGRPVARLSPIGQAADRLAELVAAGVVRPPKRTARARPARRITPRGPVSELVAEQRR